MPIQVHKRTNEEKNESYCVALANRIKKKTTHQIIK